ncbi:hypothetical protein DVH24_038836 [Malus domestica]|uniref:Pentatricopeptide repeat-containing protein n=1 Tax=Malus domestica TaxID=3750 RepID=A0A498KG41_MALDO|nr:hypothetical protein DVH24_038836 [Malus domestica]
MSKLLLHNLRSILPLYYPNPMIHDFRSSPPFAPPPLQNQNSKSTSKDDLPGPSTSSSSGSGFNRSFVQAEKVGYAWDLFRSLSSKGIQTDVKTYTIMISGFCNGS